jgi:translocator protein
MPSIARPRRGGPTAPRVIDIVVGLAPLVLGSIVGVLTNARGQRWYRTLSKPSWTPPDGVFGPVWTVLYLLMGRALVLVVHERRRRPGAEAAVAAFGGQLVLNLGWSMLFFGLRRIRLAFVEIIALWLAILVTSIAFWRVRATAGVLLLPYLAWTTFAAVLNGAIASRNRRG